MTYLPPRILDSAGFIPSTDEDLMTVVSGIKERWEFSYPRVEYKSISRMATPSASTEALSGVTGSTKVDPLWGESVDSSLTTWQQPHHSSTIVTSDPAVYSKPKSVHCRIERGVRKSQMEKYGFDPVRNMVGTIPTVCLDEMSISVSPGDRIRWAGDWYEVLQCFNYGWYFNTNIPLYVIMSLQSARIGS